MMSLRGTEPKIRVRESAGIPLWDAHTSKTLQRPQVVCFVQPSYILAVCDDAIGKGGGSSEILTDDGHTI